MLQTFVVVQVLENVISAPLDLVKGKHSSSNYSVQDLNELSFRIVPTTLKCMKKKKTR